MTNEYKPRNFRIISYTSKARILHVEDALDLGKIRLEMWSYEKGKGASANVEHYMDADDARLLFVDLSSGQLPEKYEELKGTFRDGEPQSRTLRVEDLGDKARQPIKITISNGPGEVLGAGAIKPKKGAKRTEISVLLPRREARKIALAVLAHMNAWAAATYYRRLAEGIWQPEENRYLDPTTGEILDEPTEHSVPLAGTSTSGTPGNDKDASPGESQTGKATAADFYALANEALKVGVTHKQIQDIANSANGDGWAGAIMRLQALMDAQA